MREQWKRVPQFPQYEVSNRARIRKYLPATYKNKLGYVLVGITEGRKFWLHQLVMWAFRGERPPGYDVNHKDGNPSNNNLSNLEYISHRDNIRKGRQTKLTVKDVRKIRSLWEAGMNQTQIAKRYPVQTHQIWAIVHRKAWKDIL